MHLSSSDFHAGIAVGFAFLLFGTAPGLPALFLFRRSYRRVRHWKAASATMVGYKVHSDSPDDRPVSVPEFQFIADDGQAVTGYPAFCPKNRRFRDGVSVKILYTPDDPKKIQFRTFNDLWGLPIFLGIFGSVFWGISLFLFIHVIISGLKN